MTKPVTLKMRTTATPTAAKAAVPALVQPNTTTPNQDGSAPTRSLKLIPTSPSDVMEPRGSTNLKKLMPDYVKNCIENKGLVIPGLPGAFRPMRGGNGVSWRIRI